MPNTQQPTVAMYLRSASPQEPGLQRALREQQETCHEYLSRRFGHNGYEEVVYNEGSASGSLELYDPQQPNSPHRQELSRLAADAEGGDIQAVCVASMTRLSRNSAVLARLVEEVFQKHGVELIVASTVE